MRLPESQRSKFLRDYHEISGSLSGGGLSGGSSSRQRALTQTAMDRVGKVVLDVMLNKAPVRTTDLNRFTGDVTKGRMATEEEMDQFADAMIQEAFKYKNRMTPEDLRLRITDEIEIAYGAVRQTGGHDIELNEEQIQEMLEEGVAFDRPAKTKEDKEDIEASKKLLKIVHFMNSDAGKYFTNWLDESVAKGFFVYPSKKILNGQQGDTKPPENGQQGDTKPPENGQQGDTSTPSPEGLELYNRIRNQRPPPDKEAKNRKIQEQVDKMSTAIAEQGWETGNILEYTGPKDLEIRYLKHYIQPKIPSYG